MGDETKKSGMVFWATVITTAATLVYPLSMGPSFWLLYRLEDRSLERLFEYAYTPLFWALENGPEWLSSLFTAYIKLWVDLPKC